MRTCSRPLAHTTSNATLDARLPRSRGRRVFPSRRTKWKARSTHYPPSPKPGSLVQGPRPAGQRGEGGLPIDPRPPQLHQTAGCRHDPGPRRRHQLRLRSVEHSPHRSAHPRRHPPVDASASERAGGRAGSGPLCYALPAPIPVSAIMRSRQQRAARPRLGGAPGRPVPSKALPCLVEHQETGHTRPPAHALGLLGSQHVADQAVATRTGRHHDRLPALFDRLIAKPRGRRRLVGSGKQTTEYPSDPRR